VNRKTTKRGVAFRCDAGDLIGGGHAMRCLTLANALAEDGATITFVAASMPDLLAHRIEGCGHRLVRIPDSPELRRPAGNWEEPPLSDDAQLADARATGAAVSQADWLVVDHYLLDVRWHSTARDFADQILVIDDLANRSYDCDILLDQTFGRAVADYPDRVPQGAKVLAGSAYALLRPEFAREREAALERRETIGPVRRILVSLGTTDPGGIAAGIAEQVVETSPNCAVDVVLGAQAPSLERVSDLAGRHPGVSVHVASGQMADLIRDADLAVGAAGTSSWERCCLGLPSIALVMADNQRKVAEGLEAAGAAIAVNRVCDIPPALSRLCNDPALLGRMSAAAFAIVDGQGTNRTCDFMLGRTSLKRGELALRAAQPDDSRNVWLWRNDFSTRGFSQTAEPISWQDHQGWWQASFGSTERDMMVAEIGGSPVAALRFDRISEGFEVSINLAPSARSSGLGAHILAEACKLFRKDHGAMPLLATIHRDNPASRRIFEKLGFVCTGALSNSAFDRYVLRGGSAE